MQVSHHLPWARCTPTLSLLSRYLVHVCISKLAALSLTSRGLVARFVTYRHAYCATTVDVAVGIVDPRKYHVVTMTRFTDLVRLQQGQTAEYKPRPLLTCILASAIVLYFHINGADTRTEKSRKGAAQRSESSNY